MAHTHVSRSSLSAESVLVLLSASGLSDGSSDRAVDHLWSLISSPRNRISPTAVKSLQKCRERYESKGLVSWVGMIGSSILLAKKKNRRRIVKQKRLFFSLPRNLFCVEWSTKKEEKEAGLFIGLENYRKMNSNTVLSRYFMKTRGRITK